MLAALGENLVVAFASPLGVLPSIGFEEGDEAAAIHTPMTHTEYTRARVERKISR